MCCLNFVRMNKTAKAVSETQIIARVLYFVVQCLRYSQLAVSDAGILPISLKRYI